MAGAGVFRFQDGSLLIVTVMDGSGCINLAAGNAALTVNYQITGGTGRFEGASGNLTMTATLTAVLRNASNAPALLTNTGKFEGTVFGEALEDEEREDEQALGTGSRLDIRLTGETGQPAEMLQSKH